MRPFALVNLFLSKLDIYETQTHFLGHHLQEDLKHFVADGNHTLHHTCRDTSTVGVQ